MVSLTVLNAILLDTSFLDPINIVEEKEKFFNSESYNPIFKYKKLDFPVHDFRKNLELMILSPQDDDKRISQIIQDTAREYMLLIDLLKARSTSNFGAISEQIFPPPSINMVKKAKDILNQSLNYKDETSKDCDNNKDKILSSKEIIKRLEQAIKDYSLPHKVFIGNISSRAKIDNVRQKITLNVNEKFGESDITKIIVHELGAHAIRFKNGSLQKWEVFKAGTAHYVETEEGLAKLAESKANCLKNNDLSAGLCLAVSLARTESFRTVFNEMKNYFSEQIAFKITLRVKRGLGDASLPGAYTKDASYFTGYLKVRELSDKDINILKIGRVGFQYLPILKELVKEKKLKIF